MSDPTNSPDPNAVFDEHVLVEQGAWVRRLARGLVSDDAAAEDLSQDVMMAALSSGPALSGAQLRGWLGTAARRMAGRGYERDAARRHTERSVARHESEDRGVSKRLELHRQLTSAVERLDEPYRTALVLRYFEGLPPREIAERLDITPAAARKRVSRGLAHLREDLDGEFGDRNTWLAALAPLAFPLKKAAPLGGGASLLALAKTKTAFALGVASVAGLVYLYTPIFESSPPVDGLESRGGIPVSLPVEGDSPFGLDPGMPTSNALAADAARTSVEGTPAQGPMVRVVDAAGDFPSQAHAAWLDRSSQVHSLELDAEGRAPRPAGSSFARFFAYDPLAGSVVVQSGTDGEDLALVLAPGQALVGRVLVDGSPPERPLFIRVSPTVESVGLRPEEKSLTCFLEDTKATCGSRTAWTDEEGRFTLPDYPLDSSGILTLPSSHALSSTQPLDTRGNLIYEVGPEELTVLATRRPTILGRFVWADTGLPITSGPGEPGIVWSKLMTRDGSSTLLGHTWIDRDGRFGIGLPEADTSSTTLLFGLTSRTQGPGRDSTAVYSDRFELTGESFPVDLGTIAVKRPSDARILVLGPTGAPLAGATLSSSLGSAKTDQSGHAILPCEPGETLFAIAPGTSIATLQLGNPLPPLDTAQTIQLEEGVHFAVDLGPHPNALQRIELAWDVTPYQGVALDGPGPFEPFPAKLLYALNGALARGGEWRRAVAGAPGKIRLFVPPSGRREFTGMRPGATFKVRLVDSLGVPFVEKDVTLPGLGESLVIQLLPEGGARLKVRVVDSNGQLVRGAKLTIASPLVKWDTTLDCPDGTCELGPLAMGTLNMTATDPTGRKAAVTEYSLNTPDQVLELVLESN